VKKHLRKDQIITAIIFLPSLFIGLRLLYPLIVDVPPDDKLHYFLVPGFVFSLGMFMSSMFVKKDFGLAISLSIVVFIIYIHVLLAIAGYFFILGSI
jgi:hypothetical protein